MQDTLAIEMIGDAIGEAVKLVAAVTSRLEFNAPYPLMLAGGVACSNPLFRDALISRLSCLDPVPDPIRIVDDPVNGCLSIARTNLSGSDSE